MKEVPVGNKIAYVDDEDYDLVSSCSWYIDAHGYPMTATLGRNTPMHVVIIGAIGIDHKDCNPLNNTRSNLRRATSSQQGANRRKQEKSASSRYKGVNKYKQTGKWVARINKNRKRYHLGYFTNEEDAARAYDRKAKELFGEFARLNFPEEGLEKCLTTSKALGKRSRFGSGTGTCTTSSRATSSTRTTSSRSTSKQESQRRTNVPQGQDQ